MVLFVEGTNKWCWCHPFKNKSAAYIASVVKKFVKVIDERITCLVTDAGKEWQGIPPFTEKVCACVEEEECGTHRTWCHDKAGQDSEDTHVVHVSHLVVQRRGAE